MAQEIEFLETEEVALNNLQIYQQDKALIDMQIATAKAYPRNLAKAIQNAIVVVTLDLEIAEKCCYALKKGGKTISGPSVNLAKILAQQLGNMRVENRVVGYDATHVICEGMCFDLERNFAIRTQIRKSIVGNSGRYGEDMIVITGNAANSIALRNAIFAVIDAGIVNKVYKAAQGKITGDVSDENKLAARRAAIFEGFKTTYSHLNLTDEEISMAVGKGNINLVNSDDLVVLIGFANALKNGENTAEDVFRPKVGKQPTASQKGLDKSEERMQQLIASAKTIEALDKLKGDLTGTKQSMAWDAKYAELKNKK